jgi:hypothetical protein
MAAVLQGLEHGLDAQGCGAGAVLLQGDATQGQGRRQGDLGSSDAGQAWRTAVAGCRGERAGGSVGAGPGGLQGARRKGGGVTHGGLQGLGDDASGGGAGR